MATTRLNLPPSDRRVPKTLVEVVDKYFIRPKYKEFIDRCLAEAHYLTQSGSDKE